MYILVLYQDNTKGMVEVSHLNELIAQSKIKKFLRSEGWCTVGVDPIRKKEDTDYQGPERRDKQKKDSQAIDVVEHLKEERLKEDVREKRVSQRYHLYNQNINVEIDCANQIEVLDISLGGISFKSDLRPQPAKQHKLRLKFKDQVIAVRGEVKWSSLSEYKKYSVQNKLFSIFHEGLIPIYSAGMQFINISDNQLTGIMQLIDEYACKDIEPKDVGYHYDWADFLKCLESMDFFEKTDAQAQDAPRDIRKKNIAEKRKTALLCGKEERSVLLKDPNKEIVLAAIENPKITEIEITGFAKLPTIPLEAINKIVCKKEWMKNYAIICALVNNPKTPVYISSKLANRLKARDLKILMKNREVSEILRNVAKQRLYSQV